MVMKAGNYNYIWQCQIVFRNGRKPIILKSSRYAWLKTKIQSVIDGLYGCGGNTTYLSENMRIIDGQVKIYKANLRRRNYERSFRKN